MLSYPGLLEISFLESKDNSLHRAYVNNKICIISLSTGLLRVTNILRFFIDLSVN